ncbi:MAG TPA: OmpA family protein [Polyangium sp.]|nr:OmpA family protein [Polyangium sp.]
MKRTIPLLLSLAAFHAVSVADAAEEGRFDAQIFRPSAAPRDLVMIQKSEVIGHKSITLGVYSDISLDPLAIASITTGQTIHAVGARLQITGLVGFGLYDWVDFGLALPFVAWQTSDNLRLLGSEGPVTPNAMGDPRLSVRVAIPGFNRKDHIKEGFGMAATGNLNLPFGNQNAFASDGALTGGFGYIVDYRFNFGLLLAANAGMWLRPDRQFAGTKVGDMANFGLAGEMYVVQRWGWSVLGGVFGHVATSKFPDSPSQVPAEALLALRFQTDTGFTLTVGGSFGANCGFGAPVFRAFGGLVWTPSSSREQELIRRLKRGEEEDADMDQLIGSADKCPEEKGPAENQGCPDKDGDKDGTIDRLDKCPTFAGGPGKEGCPSAFRKDDEIVILDPVHFATDKDIILEDSKALLDQVVEVLKNSPDVRELEIQGHTDVRASDVYNYNLSQRRVENIRMYMIGKGIEPDRLVAKGYGHSQTIYDDSMCNAPDEKLSEDCKFMTSKNRRVVFKITRFGAPQSRSLDGGAPILGPGGASLPGSTSMGSSNPLGGGGTVFPQGKDPILPSSKDTALPTSVLPSSKDSSGLPSGGSSSLPKSDSSVPKSGEPSGLPSSGGGLQSSGTPKPAPKPAPTPPPPAPPAPSKAPTKR